MQAWRDVRAAAAPRHDVALEHQLFVGEQDDVAGDSELAGEVSRRGKTRTGRRSARLDGCAERPGYLPVLRTDAIKENHGGPLAPSISSIVDLFMEPLES